MERSRERRFYVGRLRVVNAFLPGAAAAPRPPPRTPLQLGTEKAATGLCAMAARLPTAPPRVAPPPDATPAAPHAVAAMDSIVSDLGV